MEKSRKHKHTDSSFSAGFLLSTDHNALPPHLLRDYISKLGLPTVIHMIYSFELKVAVRILDGLRTRLNS